MLNSFADAFRGVWDCVKAERNMRVHLTACCCVIFLGARLGLSRGEWAALALTLGMVTSAETMNTAVEKLCDFTESRRNPHIRVIKDLAAGAVVLTALAAVGVGIALFFRWETWQILLDLLTAPLSCGLLILLAVLAVAFIVLGPEGLRRLKRAKK